jgi:drug/metabolite transporter (DMT)-like permease
MTSSTLTDLVLGLALIVCISSRQLRWRPVDPARMLKLPLILGAAGVVLMARQTTTVKPVDIVILGLSALLAVVSGAMMGAITRFRRSAADPRVTESRTGWLGVAIWFGLMVIRVGLDVAGHRMGSELAVSTGVILLILGVNRLTAALVVSARQHRRPLAMAGK